MAEAKKEDKSQKPKADSEKRGIKKGRQEAEIVAETVTVEQAKEEAQIDVEPASEVIAKAGKRSAKSQKEAEEKKAKEERKTQIARAKPESKSAYKPPRTKLERAGKKYREAAKLVEKDKLYSLAEALALAIKTSTTKFDSTVELHLNLGVDPKQAEQNVRGTVALPAGTGKSARVAVFAEGDDIAKAKAAGADIAANDELLSELEKGQINFDILIATPNLMARLAKYARLLGPKGLMPNPKSGTVTADVATAVSQSKAGRVEFRVDSNAIVHCAVGKVSFGTDKLNQNTETVMGAIRSAKPASQKGAYLKSGYISTTMGPSIKLEL